MNKYKIASLAIGALIFIAPFAASAATISNPLFSNGQTTIDATGGATVSGTFTLTVGTGEVVEWLRTQSDPSQPFVDTSVGGNLGYQEQVYTNVPFSVKVPPNTGTFYPTVQGAGIYGGNRSINGGDSVNFGPTGLGTVRVVANGTSGDPVVGSTDWMAALIAAIKASILPAPTPTPTVDPVCTLYKQASMGAVMGTTNSSNVALQGFLLSQHASIPALAAGAAFGFYGPQTMAAVSWFQSMHTCN